MVPGLLGVPGQIVLFVAIKIWRGTEAAQCLCLEVSIALGTGPKEQCALFHLAQVNNSFYNHLCIVFKFS